MQQRLSVRVLQRRARGALSILRAGRVGGFAAREARQRRRPPARARRRRRRVRRERAAREAARRERERRRKGAEGPRARHCGGDGREGWGFLEVVVARVERED